MQTRKDLVQMLCGLVGEATCRVIDLRDGWPSVVDISLPSGSQKFSLHLGKIHGYSRKSDEYRWQNPPNRAPVVVVPGTTPLLLGLWVEDEPAVVVAAEPEVRFGVNTRYSLRFPERLFREAQELGWAEPFRNAIDNFYWAFFPQLLPAFIELYQKKLHVDSTSMQIAAASSGLVDEQDEAAGVRVRQTVTRLVRAAEFGKRIVSAYGGKCAMCGINLGLVVGAHILPVSATNSVDEIWNGLALCENHHKAFDSHRIWINPDNRQIKIHPEIVKHADANEHSKRFVDTTFSLLTNPLSESDYPNDRMFRDRYEYFTDAYDWIKIA